ncbi:hypothetical protein [Neobacillus sp. FSL H8-0543]
MADDTGPEAIESLYKEWEKQQLSKEQLKVLLLGATVMEDGSGRLNVH